MEVEFVGDLLLRRRTMISVTFKNLDDLKSWFEDRKKDYEDGTLDDSQIRSCNTIHNKCVDKLCEGEENVAMESEVFIGFYKMVKGKLMRY